MIQKNILLIGFMGTGKSTISAMLKKMTGMKEVDMDAEIVKKEKRSINEIFAKDGEEYFREMETAILKQILQEEGQIISCGGGTAVKPENVALMKKYGRVVLLQATPETIYERVKDNQDRPILNGNMNVDFIRELMKKREDFYEKAADITVVTDDKSIEEIGKEILGQL